METEDKTLFGILRPVCIDVMKTPTIASILALRDSLVCVEHKIPPNMGEYVLFPFKMILQQRKELLSSSRFVESMLQCLAELWDRTHITSLETFNMFFSFICVLLGQESSSSPGLPRLSEDLQECTLRLLCLLLQHLTEEQVGILYADEGLLMVGHCIAAILRMAQEETSIQVKLLCMDSLCAFSGLKVPVVSLIPRATPAAGEEGDNWTTVGPNRGKEGVKSDGVCDNGVVDEGGVGEGVVDEGVIDEGVVGESVVGEGEKKEEDDQQKFDNLGNAFSPGTLPLVYLESMSKILGEPPSAGRDDIIVNCLSSFLPGVVLTLTKIITGDRKTSSLVVTSAALVLMRFVAILLSNTFASHIKTQYDSKLEGKPKNDTPLKITRNAAWLEESATKVSTLLIKVLGQVVHPAWRVHVAIITISHTFLQHCSTSLHETVLPCCEALIALTQNTRPDVAALAKLSLNSISAQMDKEVGYQLKYKLKESLFNLSTDLNRILFSQSDSEKIATFCLLAGYLKVLGPHMSGLVNSHAHLSSLIAGLLKSLQVDHSSMRVLEERVSPTIAEPASGSTWDTRLQFVHFHSSDVERVLYEICSLLGYHSPCFPLVDHLLDIITSTQQLRTEAIIMLGRILLGAGKKKKSEEEKCFFIRVVCHCVGLVLKPEILNVETGVGQRSSLHTKLEIIKNERSKAKTLKELSGNVVLLTCVLDCVRICAVVLGKDFNPLLMITLYPLLQKLGDANSTISHSAFRALQGVVENCGYGSLGDLLRSNADYLVNSISYKLRHIDMYPESTVAMTALLQYGSVDVSPLVADSVEELLYSLDLHQEEQMDRVWCVLEVVARGVSAKTSQSRLAPQVQQPSSDISQEEALSPGKAVAFFEEYWESSRNCSTQEPFVGEDSDQNEHPLNDDTRCGDETTVPDYATPEKQLPLDLKMAVSILERAPHYLPATSDKTRLTVLSSVSFCVTALQFEESSLLPQVHRIWPSFVRRFSDSSILVTTKAVELLHVLTKTCRDFLRRRVSKEIWPSLTRRLKSLAVESSNPNELYHQSQLFKLQKMILEHIGHFTKELDLSGEDVEMVVHACVPYFSPDQPLCLQSTAAECVKEVSRFYPDVVWFVLVQLTSQELPPPPCVNFKPLNIVKVACHPKSSELAEQILSNI